MGPASRYLLISNGVVFVPQRETPPVSTFLESHTGAAYTTTRTHDNGRCVLLWERHLRRLSDSARILFGSSSSSSDPFHVSSLVNASLSAVLSLAHPPGEGEELAITAVLKEGEEVHVHLGPYAPGAGWARLAMVGPGRDLPHAKYSDWVRLRKPLEQFRPPSVTELLLSHDGDRVLEGCVTNFFIVSLKGIDQSLGRHNQVSEGNDCPFEVQTAPISDGILPGVIRQLVIDVCLSKGIPVKEVAPAWSNREGWQEAFITNSLRIVQPVEKIQAPCSWGSLLHKKLDDISWEEQQFREVPGPITAMIHEEVVKRAMLEGVCL